MTSFKQAQVPSTMWKLYIWLYSLHRLFSLVVADTQFQEPDGRLNDFEQTFTVGDTMNIKWVAGWIGSDEQPEFVDLFVTWLRSDSYSDLLIANTTTKQAGFYPWKINVTEDAVRADNEFVLRFRPHRNPQDYNNAGPMAPSRGFLVQLASSASSSSSLSSSPTPSSTISPPSTSTTTATETPTTTLVAAPSDKKPPTNVGAIVGGVIGGVGLIILCGIAFLLWELWNWKREGHDGNFATFWAAQRHSRPLKHSVQVPTEIDGRELPVEAPGPDK